MPVGDPGDFEGEQMAMAQQHERGDQDLLDTDAGILNIEEEHSNSNAPTAETGNSKIQELSGEETEKLMRQLDLKCTPETSSTNETVTKNYDEDLKKEKDKDELQNSRNGCDLPNPSTLSEIEETVLRNEVDATNFSFNAKMDESLEKHSPKNPLLLSPVIRCVLKFLNIDNLKAARLVCREWCWIGKLALASRALIHFRKYEVSEKPDRLPVDFQSCFLDSADLFSAFKISDNLTEEFDSDPCLWTNEELSSFFDEQKEYLKELTLDFKCSKYNIGNYLKISSWISNSPMVRNDVKYLTKLSIHGYGYGRMWDVPPLHLIAHIKDLSLSCCTINTEPGIKISSLKLNLDHATFFQDGTRLDSIRINDVVDLGKTKEMSLLCWKNERCSEYVLDLRGSGTLEKLILVCDGVEIVNGETSQWAIERMAITAAPYTLNSQTKIKELNLAGVGNTVDLCTLSTSIQNLVLHSVHYTIILSCSQPIVFPNLQFLQILHTGVNCGDYSFLAHFKNCPQLTHLKLFSCPDVELKSLWIPKSVKTLTLERSQVKWLDESSWNLETVVIVVEDFTDAKHLYDARITVDNFIVQFKGDIPLDKRFAFFLEYRKRFIFRKRFYVGHFNWDDKPLEDTVMKEHVEVKSEFYVFENGGKGRSASGKAILELIPKHINGYQQYLYE